MSKEKQIEETYIIDNEQIKEMADFLWKNTLIHTEDLCHDVSETCYNAGYCKQSEWISVDERLPQVCGKYICCVKNKHGNTWVIAADFIPEMKMWFGQFGEVKNTVTHWMPLPEAPKGGAE